MSAKQATDSVLDGIAGQLGVGKRTKKPKTYHGNNLPCVTPNPKEVRGKTQSLAKPVDEATTGAECREPTPSASATWSTRATTRSEALLTTDSTPPGYKHRTRGAAVYRDGVSRADGLVCTEDYGGRS